MWLTLKAPFKGHPVGERIDVADEKIALALIEGGIAEKSAGDPLGETFAKMLAEANAAVVGNAQKAATEVVKEVAKALTLSRKGANERVFGHADVDADAKKSFGAFLVAVANRNTKALEEMGSHFCEWEDHGQKADMTTNVGSRGGFTVPTQHFNDIALVVHDMSVVRKRARIIDMTGRTVEIPTPNYVTAPSAGDTATLSGMVLRWTEEGTALNQTEPTLKQLEITNHELSGYSKLNNSLLQDSPALETFLKNLFAEGVSWYEDYAFLRGNGAKKPYGMLTWINDNSFTQSRSAGSAIGLADVAKLYGKLLRGMSGISDIFWTIHNTGIEKLITMVGGDNMVMIANDARGVPVWRILGHDVEVTEKVPALNTAGDIMLLNGKHYVIGDRKQYEVAFSEHAGFTSNQTYFRVVSRVGGQPWLKTPMTLSDASSTLGSFVALAAG